MGDPLGIKIRELLETHRHDDLCREIIVSQTHGDSRFIERNDGVMRRIPRGGP